MKKYSNLFKPIVYAMVLLFLISLNLSSFASSTHIYDPVDGVWYDDFEDYSSLDDAIANGTIESYKDCELNKTNVILAQGSNVGEYDYSTTGNEHEAMESSSFTTPSEEDKAIIRSKSLSGETTIGYKVSKIKAYDDEVLITQGDYLDIDVLDIFRKFSPVHHFKVKIDQNKNNILQLEIRWWSGDYRSDAYIDNVYMYAWDYSYTFIDRWRYLSGVSYDPVIGLRVQGDIVYKNNITSDISSLIDDEGYIDILVVGIPDDSEEAAILETDYIKIEATSTEGYLDSGYIV